jgi:hypothetical protein
MRSALQFILRLLRGRLVFVGALALYLIAYFADESSLHPSADGYYSWVYARSLVLDGDFHFANDYAQCGDPSHFATALYQGRPSNMFYAGPALAYLPLFALGRALSLAFGGSQWLSLHSCSGAWMRLWMLPGPLVGALTTSVLHSMLVKSFERRVAWLATAAWCGGATFVAYAGIDSHYSHIHLTFWSTLALWWTRQTLAKRAAPRSIALLGLIGFMIPMCRLNAGILLLPLGCAACQLARGQCLRALTALGIGALVAVLCTMGIYHYLYGSPFHVPQGGAFFHFTNPHPWLLLFVPQGGLFFWSPAVWISCAGLVAALRDRQLRAMHLTMFAVVAASIYIDSSVTDWDGSWSYGARRQLPLWPYFAIWFAHACKRVESALPKRTRYPRVATAIAVVATLLWSLNSLIAALLTSCDAQPFQRELYGRIPPFSAGWSILDRRGIDLALLPAETYFTVRYRLPWRAYRQALQPRFRSPVPRQNEALLAFDSQEHCLVTYGGTCTPTIGLVGAHTRVVVTTMHSPLAGIQLKLSATDSLPESLSISEVSSGELCGRVRFVTGRQYACVAVTAACAQSGVHEFALDADTALHVQQLQFSAVADCSDLTDDSAKRPAPPGD